MIDSKDISVVVQGAIDSKYTKKCLKSIRKYLPKAEIILSTWEGSNVEGLDFDVLIENKDPGTAIVSTDLLYNNVNRQLVSTQNGLKVASKKYTLKFRTDLSLKGNRFLKFFDKFLERDDKFSVFQHRVIVSSVYSREYSSTIIRIHHPKCPKGFIKCPFCVSDFYFFGLTEDLKSYFEPTELMKTEDMSNYNFNNKEMTSPADLSFRFSAEQYYCYSFAQRHFPTIKFNDYFDWNTELCNFAKRFVYNNFIFLGFCESQIYSDKHQHSMLFDSSIRGLITYKRFIKRYRQLFDRNYNPKEYFMNGYLLDKFKISIWRLLYRFNLNVRNYVRIIYYQYF